jgi:hypothetical protein
MTPRPSVLASVLAAASALLTLTSCSHLTPLGPVPDRTNLSPPRHLASPIILQVMRSQSPAAQGGCPAGSVAVSVPRGAAALGCYRPVGTPVTLTSAGVSPVFKDRPTPPAGQPAQPTQYGFMVVVPSSDVAAVTALIRQAYDSRNAFGVSVAGKLWQAPQIAAPFPGRQLQIAFLSENQALQLYRILIPRN